MRDGVTLPCIPNCPRNAGSSSNTSWAGFFFKKVVEEVEVRFLGVKIGGKISSALCAGFFFHQRAMGKNGQKPTSGGGDPGGVQTQKNPCSWGVRPLRHLIRRAASPLVGARGV